MVGEAGEPILVDFGSCGLWGTRLQSAGSPGRYEKLFNTSERKHDDFSLGKLTEWMEEKQKEAKAKIEEVQKNGSAGKTESSACNV